MKKVVFLMLCVLCVIGVNAQTDSIGVYAVRPSSVDRIDVLNYKQTKISSSIVKSKAKLVFDGATSKNRFTGVARFRLYFGTPSPYDVSKYYMFTPAYSAKDFSVGQFDVKKGLRYLTTASVSLLGSSIGAGEAKGLTVQTEKLRDNVYEIIITGQSGEYCIMPVINGVAGYTGVFDFTLE